MNIQLKYRCLCNTVLVWFQISSLKKTKNKTWHQKKNKNNKRRYKTMTYKETSVTHFSHRGEEPNSFRKLLCGMIKAMQPCGPLFNAQRSLQLSEGIVGGWARTSGLLNSLCLFASESYVPAAGHFLNMCPSAKCILYFQPELSTKQPNNKHAHRGRAAEPAPLETQQNKTSEDDTALHHKMKCATVNNEWTAAEDANFQSPSWIYKQLFLCTNWPPLMFYAFIRVFCISLY